MAGRRLGEAERAQIEVLLGQGLSFPQIGAVIGRDRVTVWREVRRNRVVQGRPMNGAGGVRLSQAPGYVGKYCYRTAQARARVRARRPKAGKLRPVWGRPYPLLWGVVKSRLVQRWSPVQIARWLRIEFPNRPECQVSHETIYQAIFFQARGGMRQELSRQVALRSGRAARQPQSRLAAAGRSAKPWIGDLRLSARPAEAADRAVPGHWEGDLVIGARGSSAIITLVERKTRYVMLGALPLSRVSERACQEFCVSDRVVC